MNGPSTEPAPFDATRMLLAGEKGRSLTVDAFRHIVIDACKEVEGLSFRHEV